MIDPGKHESVVEINKQISEYFLSYRPGLPYWWHLGCMCLTILFHGAGKSLAPFLKICVHTNLLFKEGSESCQKVHQKCFPNIQCNFSTDVACYLINKFKKYGVSMT
jgi:hypothetical protein